MENQPQKPEVPRMARNVVHEHHGIETDMTGCRAWVCWTEDKQYAIWEITYESSDNPNAELPYYRVNWRPYEEDNSGLEAPEWGSVGDFGDFDLAVQALQSHCGTTVETAEQ